MLGFVLIGILSTLNAIDHHLKKIHSKIGDLSQAQVHYYQKVEDFYKQLPASIQENHKALAHNLTLLSEFNFTKVRNKANAQYFSDTYNSFFEALLKLSIEIEALPEEKNLELKKNWLKIQKEANHNLIELYSLESSISEYNNLVGHGISSWINVLFVNKKAMPTLNVPIDYLMGETIL